jgi:hypothetical protein
MKKETRKKRSRRRRIRKQAHGQKGARDGQAQRLPIACCPGPEVGGCYFFSLFIYFNLKTKKIDFIIIIIIIVAFLLSYSSFYSKDQLLRKENKKSLRILIFFQN